MKHKLCIFAGTTEGRQLASLLKDAADLTACVATEYGEAPLDGIENIHIKTGRMDTEQMKAFFTAEGFARIIDATHPYATEVTGNIAAAAKHCGIRVMRILREAQGAVPGAVYVDSAKQAGEYLNDKDGTVFLTTGAKELADYGVDPARLWARVLPSTASIEACQAAGIPLSQVIAAQGPFSDEMNLAQLHMSGAKYLVTKASGKNGGFEEKIAAARSAGAQIIIIGVPPQTEGYTLDEAIGVLEKEYTLQTQHIDIIGIGPGDVQYLVPEAKKALLSCDAVIGAKAVTDTLDFVSVPVYHEYKGAQIAAILAAHPSIRRAAIVMRGDIGFFSGAKNLLSALEGKQMSLIPGISSAVFLAARLGISWEDAAFLSLHGREENMVLRAATTRKLFVLTDSKNTPQAILQKLCAYGCGAIEVAVGEQLSYPQERITRGTAAALAAENFAALSVLYLENRSAVTSCTSGVKDESFTRGKVPMTKAEVRAVTLSKLAPCKDAVIWDVGAGTGSVSIECAYAAPEGQVYAVEKNEEAIALIQKNKVKFKTDNVHIIEGTAPQALASLPAPTHVFIGGSSGNLKEIIAAVLRKNAAARIVINTVTLETQVQVQACAKEFHFSQFEGVHVSVQRSREAGNVHLMQALNPVWVFTLSGGTLPC
ncbi:MAG: precorrin-6A reductase [Clostridia bacterium]|nr:precorrin-6A reductase [Clostridia bacterium]